MILLIRSLRCGRAKKSFLKNSHCNKDAISIGPFAKCTNSTGNKDLIRISEKTEILGSLVSMGGNISIGHHTTMRGDSLIESIEDVVIGNYVIISNNVIITDNNSHPTDINDRRTMLKSGFSGDLWHWKHSKHAPVKICDDVWIGRRSMILKGVEIGRGAIVAANSVVTKNIPPYCIVAGNPAKIVGNLNEK